MKENDARHVRTDEPKSLVRGLRQQLIDSLRNDVLTGYYKAGDSIRQDEVVARYGVSRTPVREALIQLELEGLLVTTPHCGAKVAAQAPDSIHGLWLPIRRILEAYALRHCYDTLTEADFQKWEAILESMRRACERRDLAALAEQDIAFHRSLIERANEPSLVRIWLTLVGQIRSYFIDSHARYEDVMDVYREHAAIVAMFRSGNRDASVAFLAARIGDPDSEKVFEDLLVYRDAFSKPQSA